MSRIPPKWHFLTGAPFRVSDKCCHYMKKKPLSCIGCPMVGVRATEGQQRGKTYQMYGCNTYESNSPRSWPIAFWTDGDVRQYIQAHSIRYCSIYDMGYERTGCYPCPFGLHMDDRPTRFERMQNTHPNLWNYCMDNLGLQRVFEWMNQYLTKTQQLHFGQDATVPTRKATDCGTGSLFAGLFDLTNSSVFV